MPSSFRSLVQSKLNFVADDEENLEQGRIWMFTPGTVRTNYCTGFCWKAPADGTAIIEVWGAGGSGGRMCCCGFGIPGNPGAYAKKTITVATGCRICGTIGFSCGNADAMCFRGCSEPTQLCWFSSTSNGCICAQGGRGGTSICSTGTSAYCCFTASNFCTTKLNNENCGLVCNYGSGTGSCCAQAYGGDINCFGGFSCASFLGCAPNCPCTTQYHVATPPGKFTTDGGVITYTTEGDSGYANWTGMAYPGFIYGLGVAGKSPSHGIHGSMKCWTGSRTCGCYEGQGCVTFVPPGFPGLPPTPCGDHRDSAFRGGHGAVRIKFIQSGTVNVLGT